MRVSRPPPWQASIGKGPRMSAPNDENVPETPAAPSEPPAEAPAAPSKEERTLAMLAHLLGALVGFVVPLILWLVKKDTMPFVDDQGKEALNFQITMMIGFVACGILATVTCGFGSFLFLPLWLVDIILGIMAALKANEGVGYRYPWALRLIK